MKSRPKKTKPIKNSLRTSSFSSPESVEADLISGGAVQIRAGVWVSYQPKIYSDPDCTKLKEFDDPRWLRKLLWDDIVSHAISNAVRRGLRVIRIGGSYFKLEPRSRMKMWEIKPHYRLAQKAKTRRLFNKPYVDKGRDVDDDVTLWVLDPRQEIETKPCAPGMDLVRWDASIKNLWRGRYDPTSGEVSVAAPSDYEGKYISASMLMALYRKFGNGIDLMDFMPGKRRRVARLRA
jgi:hypothetical protein